MVISCFIRSLPWVNITNAIPVPLRLPKDVETIIGEGGFGKVYLGSLKDGTKVAVKLLSQSSQQGCKEFLAEVQLLMIVHHRNLVSLIGYCDEHENMALVYEYMANGNLREHLLGRKEHKFVELEGKASNCSRRSTRFRSSGNLNKKSDVYGFGILLLELITGQPAIIRGHECNTHIVQWVSPLIETGDIQSIIDPRLQGEFSTTCAWKALDVALSCVPQTAVQRVDMSYVLIELKECLAMEVSSERTHTQSGSTRMRNSIEMNLVLETDMAPHAR
ncbi:unnamed protein product [Dovyalis caffra]|uniref:Protein kinase domain-containing protein n=1 Tax=Dovyalis caffra TaxID=77055 RepID=A0AAV1QP32_9ROSI|nr:unnamed protein product [Dovyalis caffra]